MLHYLGSMEIFHIFIFRKKYMELCGISIIIGIFSKKKEGNNNLPMTVSSKLALPLISWDFIVREYAHEVEAVNSQGCHFGKEWVFKGKLCTWRRGKKSGMVLVVFSFNNIEWRWLFFESWSCSSNGESKPGMRILYAWIHLVWIGWW